MPGAARLGPDADRDDLGLAGDGAKEDEAQGMFVQSSSGGCPLRQRRGTGGQEGQRPRHGQQACQGRGVPALVEAGGVELGQQGEVEGPGGTDRDWRRSGRAWPCAHGPTCLLMAPPACSRQRHVGRPQIERPRLRAGPCPPPPAGRWRSHPRPAPRRRSAPPPPRAADAAPSPAMRSGPRGRRAQERFRLQDMGLAQRRPRIVVILAEQRLALGIDDDQQAFARPRRLGQGRGHGAEAVDAEHGKLGGKPHAPGGGEGDADSGEAARADADGDLPQASEVRCQPRRAPPGAEASAPRHGRAASAGGGRLRPCRRATGRPSRRRRRHREQDIGRLMPWSPGRRRDRRKPLRRTTARDRYEPAAHHRSRV